MLSTTTDIHDVIRRLRSRRDNVRTAIWLAPPRLWGREIDEAAMLGIDPADAREPLLAALLPGQRLLGLDEERILNALDAIAAAPAPTDCSLVYNFDLLVARLGSQARGALWDTLFRGFPKRRALLIAMPHRAAGLLPAAGRLDNWRREGRLAEIEYSSGGTDAENR